VVWRLHGLAKSVSWLMLMIESGIRRDADAKDALLEGREITAILSKSHKNARENRQRKAREARNPRQLTNSPTHQFTKSI
jgi:hypothetical protein